MWLPQNLADGSAALDRGVDRAVPVGDVDQCAGRPAADRRSFDLMQDGNFHACKVCLSQCSGGRERHVPRPLKWRCVLIDS